MKVKHISKTSGEEYEIDLIKLTCTCKHFKWRLQKTGRICKHIEEELLELESKVNNALEYINTNNPVDAVMFIEMFGEEFLSVLKHRGDIYEKNGIIYTL